MKKNKLKIFKNIINVFLNVLIYLFLLSSLFLTFFSAFSVKNEGAVQILGYQVRTLATNSMGENKDTKVSQYQIKSIPKDSLIIIQTVPDEKRKAQEWYSKLKVGDVLTFNYAYVRQTVITHRIESIKENKTGGFIIELVGDNNDDKSVPLRQVIDTSLKDSPNFVIGKVVKSSLTLGKIVVALKNPANVVVFIVIPCVLIVAYQVFKIFYIRLLNKLKEKEEVILKLKK